MRWLYAIPSSDTGIHSRATACSRSLALMSARISPVAAAASSSDAESGFESLEEIAGQGVERRVTRVKGGGESSFGREELGVPVEPVRECCSWLVRCGQRRGRVGAGVYLALKHGLDQVRALREVPVQRSDSDAGQVGDLPWRARPRLRCRRRPSPLRAGSRCCVARRRAAGAPLARVRPEPRRRAGGPRTTPCSPSRHSFNLLSGRAFRIVPE